MSKHTGSKAFCDICGEFCCDDKRCEYILDLEARVKELERENNNLKFNIIEYMKKENLKLEAQLEMLTKCECEYFNETDRVAFKCQGCKNKKLLEGVKGEW